MPYKQLTQEKRYEIKAYMQAGFKFSEITKHLGVHRSTIYREISRNRGLRGYRPHQADQKAIDCKRNASKHIRFTPKVQDQVTELLKDDFSPEQVSGCLSKRDNIQISHETIY